MGRCLVSQVAVIAGRTLDTAEHRWADGNSVDIVDAIAFVPVRALACNTSKSVHGARLVLTSQAWLSAISARRNQQQEGGELGTSRCVSFAERLLHGPDGLSTTGVSRGGVASSSCQGLYRPLLYSASAD